MADLGQLAVDQVFALYGAEASYMPPGGGTAIDCAVIRNQADRDLAGGLTGFSRPIVAGVTIEVRASEIAQPQRAGVFVIAGQNYQISEDPKTEDPDRLVWTCTVGRPS